MMHSYMQFFDGIDLTPLMLSFKLAFITVLILAPIGILIAYRCAFTKRKWKYFIEPLMSMPLVLPPTVLGFYLLVLLK